MGLQGTYRAHHRRAEPSAWCPRLGTLHATAPLRCPAARPILEPVPEGPSLGRGATLSRPPLATRQRGIGMHRSRRLTAVVAMAAGLTAAFCSRRRRGPRNPSNKPVPALRPPAVPLVASDPYLSIWSLADRLTDATTQHWTRRPHPLVSLIRIDGKTYRLMGTEPKDVPAMKQVGVQVFPTRTVYDFDDGHVHVTLTFMTPALPEDLDVLARPLTYLTWEVRSVDGADPCGLDLRQHQRACWRSTRPTRRWSGHARPIGDLTALRVGTVDQTLLQPAGDDTRIDWGYAYAAAPASQVKAAIGASADLLESFVERGNAPRATTTADAPRRQRPPAVPGVRLRPGPRRRRARLAAPDDRLRRDLRDQVPRAEAAAVLAAERGDARRSAPGRRARLRRAWSDVARRSTGELMADLTRAGGERYAADRRAGLSPGAGRLRPGGRRQQAADALRQGEQQQRLHRHGRRDLSRRAAVPPDGADYAKALVAPALVYSTSPRWKFPFAPHDVGTYPQANGQVYGGGEESKNEADMMPVEESANLILLCAAIARMEGNADFASKWWPQLTRWEAYLEKYGEDPENQLCTDDFMGHLAHNANLSVKAILAIAAYGELCRMRGDAASAREVPRPGPRERPALDEDGRRRRPLPHRLRQAEHLEPEVQPGLGQAPGPQRLPAGGRAAGGRLLQEGDASATACRSTPAPGSRRRTGASGAPPWPAIGPTSRRSSRRSTTT